MIKMNVINLLFRSEIEQNIQINMPWKNDFVFCINVSVVSTADPGIGYLLTICTASLIIN